MSDSHIELLDPALAYLDAGLSVLPAHLRLKYAAIKHWKPYQSQLPTRAEVEAWFGGGTEALCIIAGNVSGHLEILDFDLAGEAFAGWCDRAREIAPALADRLVIETSPSGGRHVAYRCEATICGSIKLAQRKMIVESNEPVILHGKEYIPRRDKDGRWHIIPTLIETRGEGGLFLCAPSSGYVLVQGDFTKLPVLTADERESLLEAAWSLNEYVPEPVGLTPTQPGTLNAPSSTCRPGDDFNARGDVRALLLEHGWTLVKGGENEYWRRPGKTHGWSATLKNNVFYVFSSNATPFEPQQAYAPFAVYAHLEHGGDFASAASSLRAEGFGSEADENGVDLSHFDLSAPQCRDAEPSGPPDPGPLPEELLRIPGFVSEVMDYSLETAPYPNVTMAFCGALALQAFLAGRKVRDPGDNRTNVYLLGLAHSAAGKDWPRKVNTRIVYQVGMSDCLGERFASGEGIQDALFIKPSMLFQTDEIDGMLQTINKAKDARHENVMSTLLTLYSASNSVFPMRRKASKEPPGAIDQPNLVIFGTAIPNHYYEALSERMLTNGFFARMVILESGPRPKGQEPKILDLPPRILATAKWWADFQPGTGNLEKWHPEPRIIEHTDEAKRVLVETREQAEAEYASAETAGDPVGTTVWGRVSEQTRKLALIYAVSENHEAPRISLAAMEWATKFVMHQTKRMLFMAQSHVADNPFHADCLKFVEKLRNAPDRTLPHSVLLKRMKLDAQTFQKIVDTLCQQGDIKVAKVPQAAQGRPSLLYQLEAKG